MRERARAEGDAGFSAAGARPPRPRSCKELRWRDTNLKVAGFARPPEGVHDLLHILRARAGTHEQRVLGVDDDHVLESDRGDQPLIAEDQASMGVDEDRLTIDRVAVGVRMHTIAKLCPVPDVGPIEVAW